jgi:hypothetical protein
MVHIAESPPSLEEVIGLMEPGDIHDNFGIQREGRQRLRSTLTIVDGRPLPKPPAEPLAPWIELTPLQARLIQEGHAPPFGVSPDVHQALFERR